MNRESQKGQILSSVLFLMVILTTLIGMIILYARLSNRFVISENRKVRNLYLARSACEQKLNAFRQAFREGRIDTSTSRWLESDVPVSAKIKFWGMFPEIIGSAGKGKLQRIVSYRIGTITPPVLRYALILTGPQKELILADGASIHGDVVLYTIKKGIFIRSFDRRFNFSGNIINPGSLKIPQLDTHIWDRFYGDLRYFIRFSGHERMRKFPEDLSQQIHFRPDSYYLYRVSEPKMYFDSLSIRGPMVIYSSDDIFLTGNINLKNKVILYSEKKIRISGRGTMKDVIVIAPKGIELNGSFEGFGQFYSERSILLDGNSNFIYPSIFFVDGRKQFNSDCRLEIAGKSTVEGLLFMKTDPNNILQQTGQSRYIIRIGTASHIKGFVYSDHQITLQGHVDGIVITREFFFYSSPTYYYNWIIDGHINRSAIKTEFPIPILFTDEPFTPIRIFETIVH